MYGASPRASIALAKASRVYAFIQGDDTVLPEHVHKWSIPCYGTGSSSPTRPKPRVSILITLLKTYFARRLFLNSWIVGFRFSQPNLPGYHNNFAIARATLIKPATIAENFINNSACEAFMRSSRLVFSLWINSFRLCWLSTWDCSIISVSASACSCGNPTASNFLILSSSLVIGAL